MKKKTIYGLRTRFNDNEKWSEPQWFKTKTKRDKIAAMNRIIGGIRTYSFQEAKELQEIEEIEFD